MTHSAQTILVTGSNSGFGRLTVETLARQGHIVFAGIRELTGKNATAAAELRALAEQEKLTLHVVEIDVTDMASITKAIEHIIKTTNRIDTVVNNAGVSYVGPLEAFTIEQVQKQFDVNVFGAWRVNNAVLPQMRAQKSGLLLHVGSTSGRIVFPILGLYGTTKFALEGLTEAYRYELAALGIDSVIVEPGVYPTSLAENRHIAANEGLLGTYSFLIDALTSHLSSISEGATPPNPQEVADAIAKLIAQPAGERPLRTVIASGPEPSPLVINDITAKETQSIHKQLGLLPLVTLATK
jgi:NAD(P)-dependent dehydrogenase (short-subunit alcohol dehydrogenase family)